MTRHAVTRTMPGGVRGFLVGSAIFLGLIAAGGNFGHVLDFATDPGHGNAGDLMGVTVAFLPDVLLILSLIKLRYDPRSVPAWVGLVSAVGFVGYASVRMTTGVDGRLVGLWPLWVACFAAMLLELSGTGEAAPVVTPVTVTPDATPVIGVIDTPVGTLLAPLTLTPDVGVSQGVGDTRQVIAETLANTPASVTELMQVTGRSRTAVTRHLTKLGARRDRNGMYRLPVRKVASE